MISGILIIKNWYKSNIVLVKCGGGRKKAKQMFAQISSTLDNLCDAMSLIMYAEIIVLHKVNFNT
jgi:hypothetical protein